MDYFEGAYLFCNLRIGLVPGPRHFREPFFSTEMDQLEECAAADVVRAFSALEGVTLVAEGGTASAEDWHRWAWRWEHDDRSITIGFSVMGDGEPALWGGSDLVTSCTFADLVRFWRAVQARFPAVWLHGDDSRLFTPPLVSAHLRHPAAQTRADPARCDVSHARPARTGRLPRPRLSKVKPPATNSWLELRHLQVLVGVCRHRERERNVVARKPDAGLSE